MAGERRPDEERCDAHAFPSSVSRAAVKFRHCLLGALVLSCLATASAQLSDELLCRAGSVTSPVQAGINYTLCPDSRPSRCQIEQAFTSGQKTANITVPVAALVQFTVRFSGYNNPPFSAVTVMPISLRSRVTATVDADDAGPFAVVRWSNSTSDITVPYNCLELGLDPPGLCAFRLCRKDCTTPQFELEHLNDEYESLGGIGTLGNPIKMRKIVQAQVGEMVSFDLKLENVVLTDLVDIEGRVDGGVPIGMVFMPKRLEGTHTTVRTIQWVPHKGQQGQELVAHFVGWNCPPVGDTVPCPVSMVYLDIHFEVEMPVVSWFYPDQPGPIPADVLEQNVVVGQKTEIELACRAIDSSSMPMIQLLNASIDGELVDTTQRTGEMGDYGFEFMYDEVDPTADRRRVMQFDFMPAGGDEGGVKQWCFNCGDSQDLGAPNVRCITLRTNLCQVYVEAGDTLQTITRRYHLDRNWRRLWNTNPEITNPYVELHAGRALQVGPVYRVRQGDTLSSIAARFETTVKKVLMANPHLAETEASELAIGQDVCVLPCTNKPPPSHFMGTRLLGDNADHE